MAAALLVVGCGGGGEEPLPAASSAACTQLVQRLPARVLDQQRAGADDPDGTGTAGWGDPPIRLRCGLPPSQPTTTPCQSVDGVDWLFTEQGDAVRFATYGRDPGVELSVPLAYGRENATAALVDLAAAVRPLPVSRRCS